jgi:tripartite-type tricarboxylate transporter receptor subunit TctC
MRLSGLAPGHDFIRRAPGGKTILAALAFVSAVVLGLEAPDTRAQTQAAAWPSRPIRVIVPFPAGGPSDVGMRLIAQKMSDTWGQQVIVDNRPGANTIIGAEAVARAPADGYTLLFAIDSTLTMNQHLYAKIPYDPVRDFAPVSLALWSPLIMVVDAVTGPASVKDLIARARANPGKLSYGAGTLTTQLAGEQFKRLATLDIMTVPYKGSPPTVQGLLSGDVSFIVDGVTSSVPHIKTGKLRAIATMGSKAPAAMPGLPIFATEAGLRDFDIGVWLGLVAPAGTPSDIVTRLHQEVSRILALADVRDRLNAVGLEPMQVSPAEFGATIARESARWGELIRQTGMRLD